jgi:TonB-dependent SusC/RagA subfamily outer membrane receptor
MAFAVQEVARQAHMRVMYDFTNVSLSRRVSLHLANVPVMAAVATILKGTNIIAQVGADGETIMLRLASHVGRDMARAAGGIIVGRITDSANGQGLGGASVRVEGVAKLSAVTSDSGNFTLRDVPPGDQVLQVRLFGYRPAQRTVTVVDNEQTTVRIVMVPVPTVLSGVVTTATGLQRKVEVGNDISTINVDSVLRVAPVTSVTDLLETRVPGLTVLHSSGTPGDPSRLRLRGAGSITGNNDPILIVDGVRMYASQSDPRNNNLAPSVSGGSSGAGYAAPSPLDQIDPNSIETIEIFKGPSATAIYGSDAANGVIVITTKRGRGRCTTPWTSGRG